uniref:Uncharacterized protein n=1 Tax=Cryptomonas curvata TaxID=233186 RepID=A0A7S0M6B3_9CRYP
MCGAPENSVTIESGMVSCLRKHVTISFVASLVSNPDGKECRRWVIILNVNNTFHSKKSLCGCDCQGVHEMEPVENHMDYSSIMSCSFKVKLSLEHQTLLNLQLQSENETNQSNDLFVQMSCTVSNPTNSNGTHSPTIHWSINPDRWISFYLSSYHSIVRSAMKLNLPPQSDGQILSVNQQRFDFPVFVMNLPHRNDRRRSTEGLLSTLGFTNVIFPNVTLASAIDPDALVQDKFVSRKAIDAILARKDKGPGALRAYLANALDQVDVVRAAVMQNLPLFAIMEDDLMPVGDVREFPPFTTSRRRDAGGGRRAGSCACACACEFPSCSTARDALGLTAGWSKFHSSSSGPGSPCPGREG